MPVSIPEYSKVGEGLQVPRLDMVLKPGLPEGGVLKSDAFEETRKVLENYVKDQAFPGAVLMVGYRGSLVLEMSAGRIDYTPTSAAVTPDTIYDLASLSKAVGTTTAAMMLAESGRLLLNTPVQDYLPEFAGPNKEKVRVANLLTHSAGLPAWQPLYKEVNGYAEVLKKVFAVPLEFEPETKLQYSDLGMILMGEILSRAAGRSLDKLLSDRLFAPLGMQSTTYKPPKTWLARIAPTEDDPWRKRVVHGEVHDENAYVMGGVAGHAGLFSSARDLAVFAQMMLNQGIYDHRRYLRPETIARFTAAQGPPGSAQGFGWRKPSESNWTGRVFSPSAYGHTGFTGTSIWIDPERQAFIILLSNRVHPSRKNQKIDEARRAISESVMSILTAASGQASP
jgi:CubicO group peptidase (beta-lactamase class C family)